jgi:hypothetical protein
LKFVTHLELNLYSRVNHILNSISTSGWEFHTTKTQSQELHPRLLIEQELRISHRWSEDQAQESILGLVGLGAESSSISIPAPNADPVVLTLETTQPLSVH